ncbi:glycosyltransferase involved in cell wall biosynthesis [Ochrobactrum daejeonense]|uniref:Glycosyltransferase involved in cell wall biosynthesis n=1 Tax=Brucella daejeonensis TaxID=659015 RepID=A0A7W9B049_9HYPH|nr:glycosyltransferase family A protein [Brucella daejeonensis]MBB5703764.1 glycosyltransferase involved in cell wall biosynthesis [Brucella daejeonensis]
MTMRQRPAVSVVIPHYNQNESLERCIASVACQLEGQDEIIVVDDHSAQAPSMQTEGSGPAVRIIVLPENRGPGTARNIGAQQARCDYIAFLDADDAALPDRIDTQLRVLKDHPDWAGCVGGYIYHRNDERSAQSTGKDRVAFDIRRELIAGQIFAAGSTLMLKRQLFLDAGGYNPRLRVYEDWDLLLRAVLSAGIGHCGTALAVVSPSTRRAGMDDRLRVLAQLGDTYAERMKPKERRAFMQALAYERASAYFRAGKSFNGLVAILVGFRYAPLTIMRRLWKRVVHGMP